MRFNINHPKLAAPYSKNVEVVIKYHSGLPHHINALIPNPFNEESEPLAYCTFFIEDIEPVDEEATQAYILMMLNRSIIGDSWRNTDG